MKNLCGSLVSLALVAMRNGEIQDAARLMSHAARADDCEELIEALVADNCHAIAMCSSMSPSVSGITDSIAALSASLDAIESDDSPMYDDEEISISDSDEDDDESYDIESGVDIDFLDEEDEEEEEASCSSIIRLVI